MPRSFVSYVILAAASAALIGTASAQGVVAEGAKWEKVSSAGKAFAEGVVSAKDGSIYLVDLAPPGTLFRFDPKSGQTETVMSPSNLTNGLHVDKNGDLLMAQDQAGAAMLAKRNLTTGEVTKIVDNYQGKKLIAPNDITSDAQGRIYFTDSRFSQNEEPELPNAVYRLDPDGKLTQLTTEIGRPNGIEVSPDGKRLYVADTIADRFKANPHNPGGDKFGLQRGGGVIVYDLATDGSISNGRVFWKTDVALPDGMTMDTDGNLYVASHDIPIKARLLVTLDQSGKVIQQLPLPDEGLTVQVGFGRGDDAGTLYLATALPWGLWRIKTMKTGFYQN
jgi:gluconolactonase